MRRCSRWTPPRQVRAANGVLPPGRKSQRRRGGFLAAAGEASLIEVGAGAAVGVVTFGSVRSCAVTTVALALAATSRAELTQVGAGCC